jgi:hypothetical protein
MRLQVLAGFACLWSSAVLFAADDVVVEVRKIWDEAPHNAFTDLIRFEDEWYCVFREGQKHVSPDGALRVITSRDGREWTSAARITSPEADLRDAKITVTPQGQLMLCGAAAMNPPSNIRHQSLAWFSKDGRTWSEPVKIGEPDFWLWRVTWRDDAAWGIGYATTGPKIARLYKSRDGRDFDVWVETLFDVGYPNESSLLFQDGTCLCLLRRDGEPNSGLLGIAQAPYKQWTWKDLGVRIGGPHMIQLPDGRIVAAGRSYDSGAKTRVWWLDPHTARLEEIVTLPSGGDTSYPGLVFHDGLLWVSYYSSHEGKTSIYLAKLKLRPVSER